MLAIRKLRIRVKLLLMIGLIMVFMITLTFGSLYYSYFAYDRQLLDKSSRLLNLSSRAVDMELKRIETLSMNMIADNQIQQSLKELNGDVSEYSGYIVRKAITERMWTHISMNDRYVQSAHLIDLPGKENISGESITYPESKYKRILEEAAYGEGAVRWLYPDDSEPMLIMVRQVRSYDPLTLKPIGILFLRINIERLVKDYEGYSTESGGIYLKSSKTLIYPHPKSEASPAGITEVLQPLDPGEGYAIRTLAGKATFVSQKQSAYTGWMYYNVVPYNEIFETIIWVKRSIILLFLIASVLVIAFALAVARSLTNPIEALIRQMKGVQYIDLESGDFSLLPSVSMDEVGLLQRNFRLMIVRINSLIKENYSNQLIIKETEFKALQAQINPHFLYNTLDSIHWLAKKNKQEQISQMVVSLGFLLRSSISLKRNVITIAEELGIVDHYITIQKYRFRERLDMRVNVGEEFYLALIPKLTLQPLLENAIQYALEPMIQPCCIQLSAWCEEDKLVLAIEDNGPGMTEAFLQQMLRGEVKTRGTGIGLLNIQERIKLAFGNDYGLRVISGEGTGTRVEVLIPLQKEG
ncbi:MAG: sensor histidine kinase [Paenibacillus sp.]|nr:sensor histidine kinase [Paenibacillus sp.]